MTTMISTDTFSLPAIGLGTWELTGDDTREAVRAALEAGYRHIDTAQLYRNETEVGQAIAASPVPRDEIFLTTKVWRSKAAPADVERTTVESLARLGVDHVDLLLLHWPAEDVAPLEATLEALSSLKDRGMTRHIGVSNFPAAMFERACALAPVVNNQVEHHPYLGVDAIRAVAASHGAIVTAYCPLARGEVLDDPILVEIAEDHGVSTAQVALRWQVQRGVCAIPKSRSPERIRANGEVFGFELGDDEVARIDGLTVRNRRLVSPSFAPDWDRLATHGAATD